MTDEQTDEINGLIYNFVLSLVTRLPLTVGQHSFTLSFDLKKVDDKVEIHDVECKQTETTLNKLITVLYNTDQRLDLVEKMLAKAVQDKMDERDNPT